MEKNFRWNSAGAALGLLLGMQALSTFAQDAMTIDGAGQVGIGTETPSAKLHIVGDLDAKVLVSNTHIEANVAELFELSNNGNVKFIMTNTNANKSWAMNAGTSDNTPDGENSFRISAVGDSPEFSVFDTGNATLAGLLTQLSDVNSKEDIVAIEHETILTKVMELPISEWSYKTSPASRHIGPMAQDFYHSFGLGDTDTGISSIDTGGVALAAIQAVKNEKDTEIARLSAENIALESRMIELEMALTEVLRRQSSEIQVGSTN